VEGAGKIQIFTGQPQEHKFKGIIQFYLDISSTSGGQ
jgi:hypothetical protein